MKKWFLLVVILGLLVGLSSGAAAQEISTSWLVYTGAEGRLQIEAPDNWFYKEDLEGAQAQNFETLINIGTSEAIANGQQDDGLLAVVVMVAYDRPYSNIEDAFDDSISGTSVEVPKRERGLLNGYEALWGDYTTPDGRGVWVVYDFVDYGLILNLVTNQADRWKTKFLPAITRIRESVVFSPTGLLGPEEEFINKNNTLRLYTPQGWIILDDPDLARESGFTEWITLGDSKDIANTFPNFEPAGVQGIGATLIMWEEDIEAVYGTIETLFDQTLSQTVIEIPNRTIIALGPLELMYGEYTLDNYQGLWVVYYLGDAGGILNVRGTDSKVWENQRALAYMLMRSFTDLR